METVFQNPTESTSIEDPTLETALLYAAAGIAVFPCKPTKAPATQRGFKDATTDPEKVKRMFSGGNYLIGVPTGEIVAIDVEDDGTAQAFEGELSLAGIPMLVTQRTVSGGRHFLFRTDTKLKNEKLARAQTGGKDGLLIETRGEGGYICTGGKYEWLRDDLTKVTTLDAERTEDVLAIARTFDELPKERKAPTSSGNQPGDDYNRRGDWRELLMAHGWQPAGGTRWRRPGKGEGISADFIEAANLFHVFTSNAEPLEGGCSYSPFALFATLEHGGNFSEAAGALARQGYGSKQASQPTANEPTKAEPVPELSKPDFADLAKILEGNLEPERPTICSFKNDEGFLFYAGRLNEVHGEPGIGKSNVALAAVVRTIADGGAVVYIDPEDNPTAFVRKLLCYGAKPEGIVKHVSYTNEPNPKNLMAVLSSASKSPAVLVVIDGLAECLSAGGFNENDAADFIKFVTEFLRPLARTGAAVLVCDHVVKSPDGQGRWARGSGAKLGAYDGVSFLVKPGQNYSPTLEGFVRLEVSKDRNGGVGAVREMVAEVWFSPDGRGKTQVTILRHEAPEEFKPTTVMAKIVNYLKSNPDANKRELRKLGNSTWVDRAIECLKDEGALKVENEGAGKRAKFVLIDSEEAVIL